MRISDCSSDVCSSDLDYPASSERHAIAIAREIVGRLTKPDKARIDHAAPEPPHYDPPELYGILPQDIRTAFDMRAVIARLISEERRVGKERVRTGISRCSPYHSIKQSEEIKHH